MLSRLIMFLVFTILGFVSPALASPTVIDPHTDNAEHVTAKLLMAQNGWYAGVTHYFALELTHADGWHSYWTNPGDSGLPTQLQLDIPPTFNVSALSWPAPSALPVSSMINYGYRGSVRLYFSITAPKNMPVFDRDLQLKATWLSCQDICIPEDATFTLPKNILSQAPIPDADFIKQRLLDLTYPKLQGHFFIENETLKVIFTNAPKDITSSYIFIDKSGIISPTAVQDFSQKANQLLLSIPLEDVAFAGKSISGFIRLNDTPFAFAINSGNAVPALYKTSFAKIDIPTAILYAVIGGILLNIMPCVFPILFLKALSLAKLQGKTAITAKMDGIIYACGILTGFVVISGIMILLKQAGMVLGWGFQLQQPWFVATLILVLFFVVLGVKGNISLSLPIQINHQDSYYGAFFTGLLATVLASPCTVPFMAPAVGLALTLEPQMMVIIFSFLGLGMALPYLVVSFIPSLYNILPKPGAWMERFREFLSYPLTLTMLWLLWILGQQNGLAAIIWMLLGLLTISFIIWLIHGVRAKLFAIPLWILLFSTIFAIPFVSYQINNQQYDMTAQQAFSIEKLNALRKENKAVFVYATADWCITCKVNEGSTLSRTEIQDFFKKNNIIVMRADWTKRDDNITNYLKTFNRSGVPLYAFYPAKSGDAILLPQLLTPSIVMDALRR